MCECGKFKNEGIFKQYYIFPVPMMTLLCYLANSSAIMNERVILWYIFLWKMLSKIQNGVLKNRNPAFVLDGHSPGDVAKVMVEGGLQKEPFYIFDMDEVYIRIKHFKKMMPRVKIFYAMKANDSEMMLKIAVSQGLGFDCASPGEIYKLRRLNVCPTSMIYAMPTKTPEQMMYARQTGVKHTTFDSSYELKKIKQYWPDACLLIRIRVDGESLYKLGLKFGCDFETEAVDLLEEAASLGLNVVGAAFHVGSVCSSIDAHQEGLRRVKTLFEHEARAGRGMKIVDIGGGFLGDRTDRIDQVSKLVNSTLEELFPDPSVQVIAEPGRYLCDSSTTLYCSLNNIRHITRDNKPVNMIYLNDGIYGTLRFMESWHTVERFRNTAENEEQKLEDAILWGPSCDCTDRIMQDFAIRLPRCTPHDWLVFNLQGCYSFGFASNFSCLPLPQIRTVLSLQLWSQVKDNPVFSPSDFLDNPDFTAPLPSTLPPVLSEDRDANSKTAILIS